MPWKDPVFYFSPLTIPERSFQNGNLSIFVFIVCTGTCSHRCSVFTHRKEECFKPTSADYNMMMILKKHSLCLPLQVLLNGSRHSSSVSIGGIWPRTVFLVGLLKSSSTFYSCRTKVFCLVPENC